MLPATQRQLHQLRCGQKRAGQRALSTTTTTCTRESVRSRSTARAHARDEGPALRSASRRLHALKPPPLTAHCSRSLCLGGSFRSASWGGAGTRAPASLGAWRCLARSPAACMHAFIHVGMHGGISSRQHVSGRYAKIQNCQVNTSNAAKRRASLTRKATSCCCVGFHDQRTPCHVACRARRSQ